MDVYNPSSEADANKNGEISFDAGEVKNVDFKIDVEFNAENIKRREISDFGDEGFLLCSLLNSNECNSIINGGENVGFDIIRGPNENYRSSQRIIVKSDHLSEVLWNRVKPHLKNITIDGEPTTQHIMGMTSLLQGTWKPVALNNVFRLCRYQAGGHFGPHFDGHYVQSSSVRSLQTIMLYLNGDFTGGSTNFIDESQSIYNDDDGKYCAEEKNILYQIQPEMGLAIIFNHHRLHEGQKLGSGKKYILRTDIMYENISKTKQDPLEEKALLLIQEAERKEAVGDCEEAAQLYRKAFKMSSTVKDYYKS